LKGKRQFENVHTHFKGKQGREGGMTSGGKEGEGETREYLQCFACILAKEIQMIRRKNRKFVPKMEGKENVFHPSNDS
jgi:hypothetical protein